MKQSDAAQLWPIIKAWGEGETLQFSKGGTWGDILVVPQALAFTGSAHEYRIKPKPRKVLIAWVPGHPWAWCSFDGTYPLSSDLPEGLAFLSVNHMIVELPE